MKKNYLLTLLALAVCPALQAKDINPDVARSIASKYINIGAKPRVGTFKVKSATEGTAQAQNFYAFNDAGGNGFVLVAGDDCVDPVLGYSHTGSFDIDNMPPALKELLNNVAAYIDAKRKSGGGVAKTRRKADNADAQPEVVVAPLVKTQWNSVVEPYNDSIPTISGNRKTTGPAASAMAQIFNYYKYPEHGTGKLQYATPNYDQKECNIDLSSHTYDWDNMLPTYAKNENGEKNWNDAQASAVATLMYDIGAALHTKYETGSSYSEDSSPAAIENFGYKSKTYYKTDYKMSEWLKLICDNLDNNAPVMLYGELRETNVGIIVVVDGYDNQRNIHVNWGAGGNYDGYYNFHHLFPTDLDYSFNDDMVVVTFTPNPSGEAVEKPQPVLMSVYPKLLNDKDESKTYINTDVANLNVKFNSLVYYNSIWKKFNGKLRLALYNEQHEVIGTIGDTMDYQYDPTNIDYSSWNITSKDVENLSDGNYYFALQSRADGSDYSAWTLASTKYVYGLEKNGDKVLLTLSLRNSELLTVTAPLTFDRSEYDLNDMANVKFTVQNGVEADFNSEVYFYIVNPDDQSDYIYVQKSCDLDIFDGDSYTVDMPLEITGYNKFEAGTFDVYLVQSANGRMEYLKNVEPVKITVTENPDKLSDIYATSMAISILGDTYDIKPETVVPVGTSDEIALDVKYKWTVPAIIPEVFDPLVDFSIYGCDGYIQAFEMQKFKSYDSDEQQITCKYSMEPKYVGTQSEAKLMCSSLTESGFNDVPYGNPESNDMSRFYIKWVKGSTAIKNMTDTNIRVTDRWNAGGMKMSAPTKGLNIVRMSDGTVRKVIVR